MSNGKLYALIDGASEEELMPMLAELDPPAACLYAPPVQPDLVDIAPYVVLVTDEVQEWLNTRKTPWGIYITTDADLKTIRSHLRKYLYILLPDSDKPVFFRFYDPRNIWLLTSVLTDWELHSFMGPIEKIGTDFEGNERIKNFAEQRAQYPRDAYSVASLLSLTTEQYEHLVSEKRTDYVEKIAKLMKEKSQLGEEVEGQKNSEMNVYTLHYHKTTAVEEFEEQESVEINFSEYAEEVVNYLTTHGITDDKSIRGITQLLIDQKLTSLSQLPEKYIEVIEDTDHVGFFKAEKLLLAELGYLPA